MAAKILAAIALPPQDASSSSAHRATLHQPARRRVLLPVDPPGRRAGLRGGCAWALSNDLPNQISNFGGEQAAWGPLLTTNYGFDTRIHNFARARAHP